MRGFLTPDVVHGPEISSVVGQESEKGLAQTEISCQRVRLADASCPVGGRSGKQLVLTARAGAVVTDDLGIMRGTRTGR